MLIKRIRNLSIFQFNRHLIYRISQTYKKDILVSSFHKEGLPRFQWRSLTIFQGEGNIIQKKDMIMKIVLQLQDHRLKILNQKINILTNLSKRQEYNNNLQQYIQIYSQLIDFITTNYKNNCIIYRMIGWYNISNLYTMTLNNLFISTNFKEIECLLQSLNLMHYQWNNFYQKINNRQYRYNITKFYINVYQLYREKLTINHLKIIERVLNGHLTISKQNFYVNYSKLMFDQIQIKNIEINDIIWLFRQYIQSMNDDPILIATFQTLIIKNINLLHREDIDNLIRLYTLKGKINKQIYNQCIKPYILDTKLSNMKDLSLCLKFMICSQAQDYALLTSIYSLIYEQYNKSFQGSQQYYIIHCYSHYLSIKGYKINLGNQFQKKLNDNCKSKSEKAQSISHLIIQKLSKNQQITKNNHNQQKFISKCLQTKTQFLKQYNPSKKSTYQSTFQSKLKKLNLKKDVKLYKKPHFCCFQLDYLFINKIKNKYLNIQIEGMQYRFSNGLLIRQRQIRNQILQYYNIEIKCIKYEQSTEKNILTDVEKQVLKQYLQL